MTDFIKGVGTSVGVSSSARVADFKPQRKDAGAKVAAELAGTVNLSIDSISPPEAEESAVAVRTFLEKNSGVALGFKAGFSEKL